MTKMRVRVEVEIFDNMGESITLTGGSRSETTGDNPRFFADEFVEIAAGIQEDIRKQIVAKHGERKAPAAPPWSIKPMA